MKAEDIHTLLVPTIADLGLELLGVEFNPSRGASLLRVYIDAPDADVTIDDCERVSREISALLDINDPVAGRYTLEVSSPGLDRPLFTPTHFARQLGAEVKLELASPVAGRRRFRGAIRSVDGDTITIEQDGEAVELAHANIAHARLAPDYAALGMGRAAAHHPKPSGQRARGSRKS
ncbi:MAG: ribosome maturation factor RimP [Rhodanobacteraceae bacterium]